MPRCFAASATGTLPTAGGLRRWNSSANFSEINDAEQVDVSLDDERYLVLLVDQGKLEDYDRFRRRLALRESGTETPTAAQRTLHLSLLTPAEAGWLPALDEFRALTQNTLEASPPPAGVRSDRCNAVDSRKVAPAITSLP